MATDPPEEKLCPSAACEPGAILLGIVGPEGEVGYVRPRMTVDEAFVDRARSGRTPDARFRFAQPCVESGCGHWTEDRCGLIELGLRLGDAGYVPASEGPLPHCSIRAQCRWFSQAGADACRVCPYVIANIPEGERQRRGSPATLPVLRTLAAR
jgi:hypothetical protein